MPRRVSKQHTAHPQPGGAGGAVSLRAAGLSCSHPTPVDLTVPLPGLSRVSGPRLPADFSAGPGDNSQPHEQSVSLALP